MIISSCHPLFSKWNESLEDNTFIILSDCNPWPTHLSARADLKARRDGTAKRCPSFYIGWLFFLSGTESHHITASTAPVIPRLKVTCVGQDLNLLYGSRDNTEPHMSSFSTTEENNKQVISQSAMPACDGATRGQLRSSLMSWWFHQSRYLSLHFNENSSEEQKRLCHTRCRCGPNKGGHKCMKWQHPVMQLCPCSIIFLRKYDATGRLTAHLVFWWTLTSPNKPMKKKVDQARIDKSL